MRTEILWVECLLLAWGRLDRTYRDTRGPGRIRCPLWAFLRSGGVRLQAVGNAVLELDEQDEFYLDVDRAMRGLRKEYREVLRKIYSIGMTREQAARELKCCPQTISRWRAYALEAMGHVLIEWGRRMGYLR